MTFDAFIAYHKAHNSDGLRLGQRFVNRYIRNPWPELFYETDDKKAMQTIREYLERNQYWPDMPRPIAAS